MSNELQTTVEKPLMALLGKYKGQIEQILPRQFDGKRALKLIIGAINKNPTLLQCTPMSVVNSVLTAATMGLEIRPGSAYLIPFRKNFKDEGGRWKDRHECQLVVDYRGKIDLALRSGKITDIDPDIVYSRDKFRIYRDESGHKCIEHEPTYSKRADDGTMIPITEEDRGAPIGALAVAAVKDGKPKVCFMPAIDIERIHAKSKAKDGPWVTDTMEMWKKTVIHRICKTLPQTPELAIANAVDDAAEASISMDSIIEIDPEDDASDRPLLEQSSAAAEGVAERKIAELQQQQRGANVIDVKPVAEQPTQKTTPPPLPEDASIDDSKDPEVQRQITEEQARRPKPVFGKR